MLQAHIERCHRELRRNIALEVHLANGKLQHMFLHPPRKQASQVPRRPHGIPRSIHEAARIASKSIAHEQKGEPPKPKRFALFFSRTQKYPKNSQQQKPDPPDSSQASLSSDTHTVDLQQGQKSSSDTGGGNRDSESASGSVDFPINAHDARMWRIPWQSNQVLTFTANKIWMQRL